MLHFFIFLFNHHYKNWDQLANSLKIKFCQDSQTDKTEERQDRNYYLLHVFAYASNDFTSKINVVISETQISLDWPIYINYCYI